MKRAPPIGNGRTMAHRSAVRPPVPLPIVIIETIIGIIKLDANSQLGGADPQPDGLVPNLAYSEYQLQTVDYAVGFIGELQRKKIPFARYPAPYMSALNAIFDVLSFGSGDEFTGTGDQHVLSQSYPLQSLKPVPRCVSTRPMVIKHGHIGGEHINYSWSVPRQGGPWYHFTRYSKPHLRRYRWWQLITEHEKGRNFSQS